MLGEPGEGVPAVDRLVAFAEAVIGSDPQALADAREQLGSALGEAALVDAAATVALFNAIDRVADATGIPLESDKAADTFDFRRDLGIDAFAAGRD